MLVAEKTVSMKLELNEVDVFVVAWSNKVCNNRRKRCNKKELRVV